MAHPMSGSERGFTLIELFIVFALTLLLAGFAIPYLRGFNAVTRIDSAADQVLTLLVSAQERSIGQEQNSRWGVHFSHPASGNSSFAIYQVNEELFDPGAVGSTPPGDVLESRTLGNAVAFTSPAQNEYVTIVFDRGTGAPLTSATITLTSLQSANLSRSVTVHENGLIERQ